MSTNPGEGPQLSNGSVHNSIVALPTPVALSSTLLGGRPHRRGPIFGSFLPLKQQAAAGTRDSDSEADSKANTLKTQIFDRPMHGQTNTTPGYLWTSAEVSIVCGPPGVRTSAAGGSAQPVSTRPLNTVPDVDVRLSATASVLHRNTYKIVVYAGEIVPQPMRQSLVAQAGRIITGTPPSPPFRGPGCWLTGSRILTLSTGHVGGVSCVSRGPLFWPLEQR
ncbi:hypothetical protein B0H13DRAFT_2313134 [Mycena leptocephala]|nr:hypothetical protein B0H13DRAFT_2313134 [Mycena leptocephala]